jgi:hypothetical protein
MKKTSTIKVWLIAMGCIAVLIASGFQSLRAEIIHDVILADGYLEIEYSAGAGDSVSYHVVDFETTGGGSFAFAYYFDSPTISAHDALVAIATAGDLSYEYTSYDFGGGPLPFADNFSYLADSGNVSTYWSYSLGSYAGLGIDVTWSGAPTGAGEQMLTDGAWHGWYNGFNGWDAVAPRVPAVGGAGVIPEPASIGLCAWMISLMCIRRRRSPFLRQ